MISEHIRFEGFDSRSWLNLLSLFSGRPTRAASGESAIPARHGTLVLVVDAQGAPCAGFITSRGPIVIDATTLCGNATELAALCERWNAKRALVVAEGAIEDLTERAAERIPTDGDYATQWLALLGVVRELEDEGKLRFWPERPLLRLPTPAMLQRSLDLLLPDGHVLVAALWEGENLWTACAISRTGGLIDRIVGPELLLDWTGALGGDFRRDHRVLKNAVERSMGPVHLGLFAQRERMQALLRNPSPGAWARAEMLRDIIIDPTPSYVHVAVGADAARAAGQRARNWLGGLDIFAALAPAAQFTREHVARVGSITGILGWNPLHALATRLRTVPPPPISTPRSTPSETD